MELIIVLIEIISKNIYIEILFMDEKISTIHNNFVLYCKIIIIILKRESNIICAFYIICYNLIIKYKKYNK